MQVCVWLDHQMALTTVNACPNHSLTGYQCGCCVKGRSSSPFRSLLWPYFSFSPPIILPFLLSAWSSSLSLQWQLQKFHTDIFCLCCGSVCSTGHRRSIGTGGKPSFFLSGYFSHDLINSALIHYRSFSAQRGLNMSAIFPAFLYTSSIHLW